LEKSDTIEAALNGIGKVFLMFPPFVAHSNGFTVIDTIKSTTKKNKK
jgi:hypothetical protein